MRVVQLDLTIMKQMFNVPTDKKLKLNFSSDTEFTEQSGILSANGGVSIPINYHAIKSVKTLDTFDTWRNTIEITIPSVYKAHATITDIYNTSVILNFHGNVPPTAYSSMAYLWVN